MPPESTNPSVFFEDLTISLSKAMLIFENILIMGDFDTVLKEKELH